VAREALGEEGKLFVDGGRIDRGRIGAGGQDPTVRPPLAELAAGLSPDLTHFFVDRALVAVADARAAARPHPVAAVGHGV